MKLKHFTAVPQPVPDPMRPARTVNVTKLLDSLANSFTYEENGKPVTLEPDDDGWFDMPEHIGEEQHRFRNRGSGWYKEGEVADAVRIGTIERDEPTRTPPRQRRGQRPPE